MKKMKNYKILLQLLILSPLAFIFTACFDDPGTDVLLKGSFVEISEATTSGGLDLNKSYVRLNDGSFRRDSIRVNLVGRQKNSPVTVSYEILPTSTAVAGVHYQMVSTGSIQIPANSSFGYIYFNVFADEINTGETWKLAIRLTDVDSGVKLSENYDQFTRGFRITCPLDLAVFSGAATMDDPFWEETYGVTVTRTGTQIQITGLLNQAGTNAVTLNVNETTRTATIARQVIVAAIAGYPYTNWAVQGNATIDPCEDMITFAVNFSVDQGNFSGTHALVMTMD